MNSHNIPFSHIDWAIIPKEEHSGEKGTSFWQTVLFDGLRVRIVEYTPGYIADHWCTKGHIVHCLEGEFVSVSPSGEEVVLSKNMMYVVSDELSSHKSRTDCGAKLLIIDGDFLIGEK